MRTHQNGPAVSPRRLRGLLTAIVLLIVSSCDTCRPGQGNVRRVFRNRKAISNGGY